MQAAGSRSASGGNWLPRCKGSLGLRAGGNPASPPADQPVGARKRPRGRLGRLGSGLRPNHHPASTLLTARGCWNTWIVVAGGELCGRPTRRPFPRPC